MSAPAPAASRALAVLSYLTANPQQSFTLSELSSALSINMASLSAILRSLVDSGYLLRHPRHKTYELGPAVIAAGNAASVRHPVVELARPEMRRLAEETGSECVGSTVVGDEILIMVLEGRPSVQLPQMSLGQRIPLNPPLGGVFLAWSPPTRIERWLAQLGKNIDTATRTHLASALDHVRRRGYSVNLFSDQLQRVTQTLTELAHHPLQKDLHKQLVELVSSLGSDYELLDADPDKEYDGALVAAPVFGSDGSVVFAVTLSALLGRNGRDIMRTADRLSAVTLHLTRQIGGRVPTGAPQDSSA
jgi:DNA-binding IclR family transcriptional regulator